MCPLPMDCAKALWTIVATAGTLGLGELLTEGEDMDLIRVVTWKLHATWCADNRNRDALMFLTQWKGVGTTCRIALHVASERIRDPWVIRPLLVLLQRVHGCRGWNPFWVFN